MELTLTELQTKTKLELLTICENPAEYSDETRKMAYSLLEELPKQGRPKKQEVVDSQDDSEELFYTCYGLAQYTREQLCELRKLKFQSKAWEKQAAEFRAEHQKRVDDIRAAQKLVEADCKAQTIAFDLDAWNLALKQVNRIDNELQARKSATFEDYVQVARKLYPHRFVKQHSISETAQSEPRPVEKPADISFTFPSIQVTASADIPTALDPESDEGYQANLRAIADIAGSLVE